MGDNDNGGNDNCNVALNIPRSGSSGPLFPVRVEFGMLVFFFFGGGGKKTGAPEENRTTQIQRTRTNNSTPLCDDTAVGEENSCHCAIPASHRVGMAWIVVDSIVEIPHCSQMNKITALSGRTKINLFVEKLTLGANELVRKWFNNIDIFL